MKKVTLLAAGVLAAVAAAPSANAYTPNAYFGGYMRSGVATQRVDGYASQFAGRLGAENDTYGEILLGTDVAQVDDTVWSVTSMLAVKSKSNGSTWQDNRAGDDGKYGDDSGKNGTWSSALAFRQFFVNVKGLLDFDKDANIWVGKRYYHREDIHVTDLYYHDISGTGVGIEDLQVGPGKFSLAWLRHDFSNQKYVNADGDVLGNNWISYHSIDAEYKFPAWDGAEIELRGTFTQPKKDNDAKDYRTKAYGSQVYMIELGQGYSLGWNKSVLKLTHGNVDQTDPAGSKFGFAGAYAASDGTYSTWGNTGAKSANRVQFYNFGETHFTSNFGMFHVIAATRASGYDSNLTNKKNDRAFQFVVRPYYQLTKMSRVLVEAGFYTSVDKFELPDGTVEKNVKQAQKFTLAYALTPDASNFWSRPEIRFYTTYIHTNGGIDVSEWGKENKKNAFLVGAQVEAWF